MLEGWETGRMDTGCLMLDAGCGLRVIEHRAKGIGHGG
jgi:hypothetical protein